VLAPQLGIRARHYLQLAVLAMSRHFFPYMSGLAACIGALLGALAALLCVLCQQKASPSHSRDTASGSGSTWGKSADRGRVLQAAARIQHVAVRASLQVVLGHVQLQLIEAHFERAASPATRHSLEGAGAAVHLLIADLSGPFTQRSFCKSRLCECFVFGSDVRAGNFQVIHKILCHPEDL